MTGRKHAITHAAPVWPTSMPVRRWMRQPVVTVGLDTPVREAVRLMRSRQVRHLPVLDADGRLAGIVTDRDLRQVVFDPAVQERLGDASDALEAIPMREIMTWGVVTVQPGTDVRHAARLMHERKIGALPVVEHGRVVGILTETDVLAAFQETLRREVTTVEPLRAAPDAGAPYDYGFPPPGGGDPWQDNAAGD